VSAVLPRVAVGVPVLNMADTLPRALDSVLSQTAGDFELILSDNASADDTEAIGRRYASADARIRYLRQPATVPAIDNFRRVLQEARAPYFTWLAADDYMLACFLERTIAVLDARPDVVCCASRVDFADADGTRRRARGTFPLLGSFKDNLGRFLHDPMDNSRFYGVFRRAALAGALPAVAYHGWDWTVSIATLRAGLHWELDEMLRVRASSDPDKYTRMIEHAFPSALGRLLPLAPFTRALLFELRVPPAPATLYRLARLNVVYHVMYALYRYPRYGRLVHRVTAALERALTAGRRPRRRAT
jgi:glycosyltransferase involved in cell wall biosynthesis